MFRRYAAILLASSLAIAAAAPAFAALDAPTVERLVSGHGKVVLRVTAGPSGAPSGFAVYWMTQTDYDDYGSVWPATQSYPGLGWANFNGAPTLNTFDGQVTTYLLGPGESAMVEIGDLNGESGVTTNSTQELDYGQADVVPSTPTDYVFCTFAIGGSQGTRSEYSLNAAGTTTLVQNCTFTQGYWKNHPGVWPVAGLTLGSVYYTNAQLMQIFNQPVSGNGLISLAHQSIAAKLNIANGANSSSVAATIAAADAQIGALVIPPIGAGYLSPGSTSSKTQVLDNFNNGIIGPGHCGNTESKSSTWGAIKSLYR
ncbi:MAG: hypothetical protein ABIS67_06890 [Candidatus Eisenbacteria bacterium]